MAHPSSLQSMKSSCGKMAFREFWFPLSIPLQMGWMSDLGRLSSTQWSHHLTIPQALYSDGSRIFSFLTEAHHTVLPTHLPPSYSYSENFALDCLWLHLILDLAWPASKTKWSPITTSLQNTEIAVGDCVLARDHLSGHKWQAGTVVQQTSPASFQVQLNDGQNWRRHP